MRNGFKLTLMVAIALIGMRASAMVPTINPIPDPIVGDSDGVSGTNEFVYPDALNLDSYGHDTDGPNASLTWSYEGSDGKYTFNGALGLTGAESPITPPAGKTISTVDTDPAEEDSDPLTVTIRNVDLSPIGGPNVDPGAAGIVADETRVITLWASDGATAAQREIIVYTDNEGEDRLSGNVETPVAEGDFEAGSESWTFQVGLALSGGTATSASNGALCITVPAAGVTDAQWVSPYDLFELTDGSVYIGRFNLNTSQSTIGNVPLFLVHFENASDVEFQAESAYFMDAYFLDNFDGANAPQGHPNGEALHETLFTPPPVDTAQWKNGAFQAGVDDRNDFRLRFRILDVDGAGYGAESDSGQICLLDYAITKVDIGTIERVGAALYDVQTMTSSTHQTSSVESTFTFSDGNLTISPTDGNFDAEVASVLPGDGVGSLETGGAAIADEYPVPWTGDDKYYEVEIGLSAPSTTAENDPVDLIRMGMDAPTQEFIGLSQVSAGMGTVGTPKTGAAQLYRGFYAPNNVTLSSTSNHDRLRPRFDFVCHPALGFNGNAGDDNPGGLTVHGMSVYEVNW